MNVMAVNIAIKGCIVRNVRCEGVEGRFTFHMKPIPPIQAEAEGRAAFVLTSRVNHAYKTFSAAEN